MSEKIAGKTFSTPDEAGVEVPTAEELAEARKMFDEFQSRVDAIPAGTPPKEISPKFYDDTSGTEFDPAAPNK